MLPWALMAKDRNKAQRNWGSTGRTIRPLVLLEAGRVLLGVTMISFWTFQIVPIQNAIFIVVPILTGILFLFTRRMKVFYKKIETRFLANLNARESASARTLSSRVSQQNTDFQTRPTMVCSLHSTRRPPNPWYIGKRD